MQNIILVTGASSGFGRMIARDLAHAGHVAYASMRDAAGRNAEAAADSDSYAQQMAIDLRTIELDVQDERSVAAAIDAIVAEHGRLDVIVHNAGHMTWGPSEAFTPEQLAQIYDINVLGAQRVNRAVLPHMRAAGRGLQVWISSSSVAGGVPPLLGPYFAAKAAMDALAVCYAKELAPLGIETSIVVPGAFTTGTNHFAHAGTPDDAPVADAYAAAWPDGFADDMKAALAATVPAWADPATVGQKVVEIVAAEHGKRPLRVHVDPADDGAAVSFTVIDRVRSEFLHRIGHADLLHPHVEG
ncbi:SDR family NAD(P)-dependent oxidoreductase [Sphingosinicella sp. BN140058]|uniref:SDR family NAD(P)-dependent oxidoreductase n=1 Tax=Sphingosinicella sp. BN140058 TaxID=1892855 RepID=UPI0010120678|nr:SDR family NAD(P)-dependent oxidoreductase [Sphingosinicella sp. BN140058]QAY76491.1 SDR family NAD(P)-dependent oxidoreductase [Sphingosinicella sp. BN140058]